MAGPQQKRIAFFTSALIFLLTTRGVNSASSPSCTGDDCPPFLPDAVAYWPLTLETNGSDMSGNGNHATFVNLSYTDGPSGEPNSAVHFHGNRKSYSWIIKSPSMDVGKYPGFSFCGYVRLSVVEDVPLLSWDDRPGRALSIWLDRPGHIFLDLETGVIYDSAEFPNMTSPAGTWRFFGVSYNKATGRVIAFMDGRKEQKKIDANLVAETARTRKVGLGTRMSDKFYHEGDFSCMMLFKVALTADDFEKVWRFCRTRSSTQTTAFIPGALAYWPLTLETKGSDLSGNGNHATLVGLTFTDGPNGEPNSAVHFHGNNNSYAYITKSPSLEIGKYPGFSFCGYVRLSGGTLAPIIDWRSVQYGLHIWVSYTRTIWLNLFTSNSAIKQSVDIPNMELTAGSWRFFGVSYDKATGRVTGFMDGMIEQKQLDKNIVAETATTSKIGLGIYLQRTRMTHFFNGDMSCMMLFKVALTADDFERVWRFCLTIKSTPTALLNITVSDIAATTATASWTKSPGTFSGYSITIERNESGPGQETSDPQSIPSSAQFPRVTLVNLIPGATYRVRVWHMQGDIKGGARSSAWFNTLYEYDGYEVPDRSKYGGNSGSRQMPHQSAEDSNESTADAVYENLSN